ncbi:phage/plasmid replication domain-containing protein [Kineococcus aurantiacus]|uniref:Uncharacterized protein n=1 Tax=Kineococcus aurantiacus TaxID=37633 RepID=A0A7Y9J2B8_9ACTN|nr:phage/plasmid replication protein [Kineococcus aurantiacus]NYD23975.1 hypothetical protein [Kineococcus aurantiacus]
MSTDTAVYRASSASPTDRRQLSPASGVALDTVTVVGATTTKLVRELENHGRSRLGHEWGSEYVLIGDGRAHLSATTRGETPTVRLEWSVAEMLDGHNIYPMEAALLPDAVDAALTDLGRRFPDVPVIDDVELYRIDISKNYVVESTSTTMANIARVPLVFAKYDSRHYRDGCLQSMSRGSKTQWIARTYNKGVQMREKAAITQDKTQAAVLLALADVMDEVLRVELQARRGVLLRRRIQRIMDATPQALDALARELFTNGRLDVTTGGKLVLAQRLLEIGPELTDAQMRAVQLYLFHRTTGTPFPGCRHSYEDGRRFANKYNLLALSMIEDIEPHRLVWDDGVELVGSAALA